MIEFNARTPDVITVAVDRADGGVTVVRIVTTEYRPATPDEITAGAAEFVRTGHETGFYRIANWTIAPTDDYIDAVIAKHAWTGPLAPVAWHRVPNDYVDESTDRTFRNAWKHTGRGKPDVDMPKAREIHREHLRRLRAPILEDLDVAYVRADEQNNAREKSRIAARKQELRDVTAHSAIDDAQTPEQLKAAGLDVING
jgi:hypothetical protein